MTISVTRRWWVAAAAAIVLAVGATTVATVADARSENRAQDQGPGGDSRSAPGHGARADLPAADRPQSGKPEPEKPESETTEPKKTEPPPTDENPTDDNATGESATGESATGIALLGDSVTQGAVGDATWRYYLAQHLDATGVPYDLLGYRTDLYDPSTHTFGSQAYADPDFDSDHAGRWGMSLSELDVSVASLVRSLGPDVLVEMLGINDLRTDEVPPAVLLEQIRLVISDARSVSPGIDIVLVRLPQTWVDGVAEFNAGLDALAAETTRIGSQVVVAAADLGFTHADTWDGLHPVESGQVRIASAVAVALDTLERLHPAVQSGEAAPPRALP